jgi:P4 family phage/plasmid primase-like protien
MHYGIDTLRRSILYHWRGEWFRHEDGRYQQITERELKARVTKIVKAEFNRCVREYGLNSAPHVTKNVTGNLLQALQSECHLRDAVDDGTWLGKEGHPTFFDFRNGLLNVESALSGTTSVRPHSPHWFSRVQFPYEYDSKATCPQWQCFLDRVLEHDGERISLLQEFIGYCLVIDTSQHKFLILQGPGANGKGVTQHVMMSLVGQENVSGVGLTEFGERFQLASTVGKLINIVPEVDEDQKMPEGVIKGFVGGDKIHMDIKFKEPIHVHPTARLVIATNHPIPFRDRSEGIWRRIILIPFNVIIPEQQRDPKLKTALEAELPGIFNWALDGLRRLKARGHFTEPAVCAEALREYRREQTPARTFLLDHYEFDAAAPGESCWQLYASYVQWSQDHGYRTIDDAEFGKDVKAVFPHSKRIRPTAEDGRRFYAYTGVRRSQVS